MKLNGIVGKGSGKLGASVFAISGGEQIVRQYNPQVSNPSTSAQVAQRAKLKLMSQLAAALASGLGFKKNGLISARNQFVSKNIGLCTFSNDAASVVLAALQLTPGVQIPGEMELSNVQGKQVCSLTQNAPANVSSFVWVLCRKTADSQLQLLEVAIVPLTNANRNAEHEFEQDGTHFVAFGYGLVGTSGANSATYGDYETPQAVSSANLDVVSSLIQTATSSTATIGAELVIGD